MTVLVTYATRYGSTRGIAEHIAKTLEAEGLEADLQPVAAVRDVSRYDAFVVGSAAFLGSWMKEARDFVRINRDTLDARPVWIFSSGPIGTQTKDAKGRDMLVASEPKEFAEFARSIRPKEQRVFYGSLDPAKLRGMHRLFALVPAADRVLIEGDFRDWKLIETWARGIAHQLAALATA